MVKFPFLGSPKYKGPKMFDQSSYILRPCDSHGIISKQFCMCLSIFEDQLFLAHRIRISDILPLDIKSYLTHAILPMLSLEGYIQYICCIGTHAHDRQVTSLLC